MKLKPLSIWIGIFTAFMTALWSLYLHFRKKSRIKMRIEVQQHDHAKGLNACIHPVNQIVVYIVNTSDLPLTIHDIEFVYRTQGNQAKHVYDGFSFKKRSIVIGRTLTKSEQACFSMSYIVSDEKIVLDELENIILVSSYGHKYKMGRRKVKCAINKVQALPPPDPDNLCLDFEPTRN